MDRNVKGVTYTTYIDPNQVNSSNCDLTNVAEIESDRNYAKSTIKREGPPGNCRKQCEEISGKFNLNSRK